MKPLALIVDDEPDIRELVAMTLDSMNVTSITAADLAHARRELASHEIHFCLVDMRLPDGDGIELVKQIQQECPHIPVAMITAYGNVEGAVNTLKAGAFDYVSKPVDLNVLRGLVKTALRLSVLGDNTNNSTNTQLLGECHAMQALRQQIKKLARSQAPVFIQGASGTGKELVARSIHEQGPRADKPFIPVNCGAIPMELMESEFFGHIKGAFTGATQNKEGLFQAADGGTLFLDEVADLPLAMQVKLLRAIQEKAVRPIGSQSEQVIDVRILSASHKDLQSMVANGEFREDLFYRINVITLKVPSLRERGNDIEVLSRYFIQQLSERYQIDCPVLSASALGALRAYPFPGNIRELENILERAMALSEHGVIDTTDLALEQRGMPEQQPVTADNILDEKLNETERQELLSALEIHKWNRTKTAKALGLTLRQLRYRLQKLGIH